MIRPAPNRRYNHANSLQREASRAAGAAAAAAALGACPAKATAMTSRSGQNISSDACQLSTTKVGGSKRPTKSAQIGVGPDTLQSLLEMGFSAQQVREAAAQCNPSTSPSFEDLLQVLLWPDESRSAGNCVDSTTPIPMLVLQRDLSDDSQHVFNSLTLTEEKRQGQAAETFARLLLAMKLALQQGLLTAEERDDLHFQLLSGDVRMVSDVVKALRVAPSPVMLLEPGEATWECSICYEQQFCRGWRCPSNQHRFCTECMRQHTSAVRFPRCPQCEYELDENDLTAIGCPPSRIDAFKAAKLMGAVDRLAGKEEMLVRCSRRECTNTVVFPTSSERQRFECSVCGAVPFCTLCRQEPYHYHARCEQVQHLREQWLAWISGGRAAYSGQMDRAAEADRRNDVLHQAIARHQELQADELWKSQNCRLCPQCSRPISKVEGCDSMMCGQNYHGGNEQPGCGHKFNFSEATVYVAHVKPRIMPAIVDHNFSLRGRGAFHPFTNCSLCGKKGLKGIRFRCIHCEKFDVCCDCEPKLGDFHKADHVFELLFESDFRCSHFPNGTRVRLVRSDDLLPYVHYGEPETPNLEGLVGKVIGPCRCMMAASGVGCDGVEVQLELNQKTIGLAVEHLEPVLESQSQAEALFSSGLATTFFQHASRLQGSRA
mmetsp:Transcript_44501/g.82802  ORF Transcript_44501/g.82802 Transcript_44501/m.82802 type:complete len:659 (+) Transcript_44501:63-2039(+)